MKSKATIANFSLANRGTIRGSAFLSCLAQRRALLTFLLTTEIPSF
ncbi:MAG TPA: hypothetical protein VEC36_01345 [Patescibacteria group bacterium]|nr:hypothetical protein [Patescibacteria group bacterium]